jgi:hypothetical protein
MSHRGAGERFGVDAASVSRLRALEQSQGDARPKPLGGGRRSGRVEGRRPLIISALSETPDIIEKRRLLAGRGYMFGFGTIQRLFCRHAMTREGRSPTPMSRIAWVS